MKSLFTIVILVALGQLSSAQNNSITGFFNKNVETQLSLESQFDNNLSTESIDNNIKKLSAVPHHLGSKGSKDNAEYVANQFKSWGWNAEIETFYVLFPTPKKRVLEMTSPAKFKATLKELVVDEDPYSGQSGQLPPYNAYSADGDVTAGLVFVNYGLPEDYATLDKMGVDVKGKIVIAKYGRSWRGIKPKIAQEHGAVGCLIYSDPHDDGYRQGDMYPKGAFKNEYNVQRGSVMDMPVYPGDPLTPDIGATKDARRLERSQAKTILKIPVLPISYHDATPLLQALEGEVAPTDWQGNLPFTYHLGEGKVQVHLNVEFNWDQVPCYDVIAKMPGSTYPDEWVIRGNHQDAWVNGAADPVSGLAALMEEAKSIGELVKTGWKPARTLVYCAWDGEEPALLGSTEWVETHAKELQEKAVVYVNSDGNSRGFLFAQGSHALEPLMDEISKQVIDPQTKVSVFERRKAANIAGAGSLSAKENAWNQKSLKLSAMGSGSDYSSFIQHLGIPSLNLGYGGEGSGGEYHTIYDTYDMYKRFKDPKFEYGVALAQTAGRAVLRVAQADVVPFNFSYLYSTVEGYSKELVDLMDNMRKSTDFENRIISAKIYQLAEDPTKGYKTPEAKSEVPFIDFSPLQNAIQILGESVDSLNSIYQQKMLANSVDDNFNQKLYQAEQRLLIDQGLPDREWYKHALYAPGFYTGYGVKTMPGVREAIEQRNWDLAQKQINIAANRISKLAFYFSDIKN